MHSTIASGVVRAVVLAAIGIGGSALAQPRPLPRFFTPQAI